LAADGNVATSQSAATSLSTVLTDAVWPRRRHPLPEKFNINMKKIWNLRNFKRSHGKPDFFPDLRLTANNFARDEM
jgi:hypothetical protein